LNFINFWTRLLNSNKEQLKPPEYSFKPALNPNSLAMENEKKGALSASANDRIEHMLSKHERSQERLKTLRQEQEEKELKDCTFSPRTKAVHAGHTEHHYKSFHDRVSQWEKKRKAKVYRERKAIVKDELKDCTFSPDMSKTKNARSIAQEMETPGVDEFLLRQNAARERKERRDQGVFTTGENWKYRVTVPQEFTFNKKDSKIRSLDKPASPKKGTSSPSTPKSPTQESDYIEEKFHGLTLSDFGIDMTDSRLFAQRGEEEHSDEEKEEEMDYNTYAVTSQVNTSQQNNSHVPPQGLFSSRSTVSILENLRFDDDEENEGSQEDHEVDLTATDEWLKRSKEKELRVYH
jgi:hypothetical protein